MVKVYNNDPFLPEESSISDIEKKDLGKKSVAIPVELQVALTKQRIDFAEINYELSVKKGQVWDHTKHSSN
ncbi:MAG: hypothetical protein OXC82_01870 [Rhodobacteraceae bacterium]|nr:hypothetical protein [Paracoccaceae bacterium]MCY4249176.1 hypothetical protein [Paracoccaceae bacterium]MCY4307625.1 hypothetical protein [Paracoccaceae bacterium]